MYKKLLMFIIMLGSVTMVQAAPFVYNYNTRGANTQSGFTNSVLPVYSGGYLNNFQSGSDFPIISAGEDDYNHDTIPTETPEPATLILFGMGLAGIAIRKRLKQ